MSKKIEKSMALRQAEADVFADGPLEGCSRCVDKANEIYVLRQVADAADVVMHHFADSHCQEDSFVKMRDAMEPLRLALIAAGYGLPKEEKGS